MASNPVAACRSELNAFRNWPTNRGATRDQRRGEGQGRPGRPGGDGLASLRSYSQRRGEDGNAFQPFAKNKHANIQKATVGFRFGGAGAPCAVTPCHTIMAITQTAANKRPMTTNGRRRDELISKMKLS
jgi:hypothetical protein